MSNSSHSQTLLLGHNGYLGSYLLKNISCDILNGYSIYNNHTSYDYIINCIGKPSLEYCEENINDSNYANRDILLDIHRMYPMAKIIHFSSYYVYNDHGLCTEESETIREYAYCAQKLDSESIVSELGGVTFRLGKLFGHPNINKQNKLTEHIIKNKDIYVDRIEFNPTSLRQVSDVISHELEYKCMSGVYNLSNMGTVTHYDYAQLINAQLGHSKNINEIRGAKKYANYGKFAMSTKKLESLMSLTPFEVDLYNYINNYAN